MAEKVLHRIDSVLGELRIVDEGGGWRIRGGGDGTAPPVGHVASCLVVEILRLSAELAEVKTDRDEAWWRASRARAEGRRETLDDAINALDEVTGGLDIDWDEAAQRVAQSSRRALLRLRAAAESELEGGAGES